MPFRHCYCMGFRATMSSSVWSTQAAHVTAPRGKNMPLVVPPPSYVSGEKATKTDIRDLADYVNDIVDGLTTFDHLAISDADGLTVGGLIVPQRGYLAFQLKPFATVTEYDLFIAPRAMTVTAISVVPSTLQGGALTATVCKATGTSAPANGTTPMHTANAINLNTGAYTVQNITLTATAADLTLAAGDRIGIDYSAAYTTGHAALTISYVLA